MAFPSAEPERTTLSAVETRRRRTAGTRAEFRSAGHTDTNPLIGKDHAMGLFSKDIGTMDDLFVHTLRDIYYAENQIVKALPEMMAKATDPQLKQGFQSHLAETKNHVKRLEQVFEMHGVEAKGVDCP